MWVAFALSLLSIPVFIYVDNKQVNEKDLLTVNNLTLSEKPYYVSGRRALIGIKLQETPRTLVINQEELECVDHQEVVDNFKPGEEVTIKIYPEDKNDFYSTGYISEFQKIYGLTKNGQEYIELHCRNTVSTKKTQAFTMASITSGILSLIFAVFAYKSKTNNNISGSKIIDPLLIVCGCWLIVAIIFRLI
jgi:hypothetical protein